MSYRNTAILVAVLIALFGVVYWVDLRGDGQKAEPTPVQQVSLVQFSTSDVGRVEIVQGQKSVALSRSEAGAPWQLSLDGSADKTEEADKSRVDMVVSNLASLSALRVVAERASDLGEYGLSEPQALISVQSLGGQIQVVRFGSTNPDGSGRYAQLEGSNRIYLVSAYVVDDASRMIADPPRPKLTPTKAPALVTPTGTIDLPLATPTP